MRLIPHTLALLALTTACTRGSGDTADTSTDIPTVTDADGDGTPDDEDAFPDDPDEDTDTDGDGTGDNSDVFPDDPDEDADTDGDGVGDNGDAFPDDPAEDSDTDGDGTGDNGDAFPDDPAETTDTDADGVGDNADNCINAENPDQADADEDGVGDLCEGDRDSDGVLDDDDAFPDDPNETVDTDGDGVGDNGDAFPNDDTEDTDTDSDGVGDNTDNCVDLANDAQEDLDEDGLGDACDDDRDGDGTVNDDDAFPDDAAETADTDGDGVGDNADAFPNDDTETTDTDGDGVGDNADAFPNDDTETTDTDGDGTGDNADAFPNDSSETTDTDGDGTGDNADAFPSDETEDTDTDSDGVGDNADNCVDTDNADQANLDSDALGDACDNDADGDGVDSTASGGEDCDDANADINPSAKEVWYDGVDQDCSGGSDYDQDGDGADSKADKDGGTDCDDDDSDNIGCGGSADEAWTGTCKSLLAFDGSTPDGDYFFDMDGASGSGSAVELTCEMDGLDSDGADTGVGGGWTVLTSCDFSQKLGAGEPKPMNGDAQYLVADSNYAWDSDNCVPSMRDAGGDQAYWWTGDFAGAYSEIRLADYQGVSFALGGNTTDLGPAFVADSWDPLYVAGGRGDIVFGDPAAAPAASYSKSLSGNVSYREGDAMNWPGETGAIALAAPATQFRIGWGEHGPENEGFTIWSGGSIWLR